MPAAPAQPPAPAEPPVPPTIETAPLVVIASARSEIVPPAPPRLGGRWYAFSCEHSRSHECPEFFKGRRAVPIVGLFAVLVGLVIIVAREEIAVAFLARRGPHPDDRKKKASAYLWLIVGTATAIAGMLLFALTVER